jgi:hypothetical protein
MQQKGGAANKANNLLKRISIGVFPNPFSYQAVAEVTPVETGIASIEMYDASGRVIRKLFNGKMEKGVSRRFELEGRNFSSGIYFIRFKSASGVVSYKVIKSQ